MTSPLLKKYLIVTMPDRSEWAVPVSIIALHRARHYAHEFDGDPNRSLVEDALPLFESDDYEIHDWAANNMNWEDVRPNAYLVKAPPEPDYQDGWCNGAYRVGAPL